MAGKEFQVFRTRQRSSAELDLWFRGAVRAAFALL